MKINRVSKKYSRLRSLGKMGLGILVSLLVTTRASAVVVDDSFSPEYLAQCIMGPNVTVQNVTYTGDTRSRGTFSGGFADGLGIDHGVILSSGDIRQAIGPNNSSGAGIATSGTSDPDLTAIVGTDTEDAAILEFDIVPSSGTISFSYIFASEEYSEYIGQFNDMVAIFVNGQNIALVPNTTQPVGVNTITPSVNSQFYVDNESATHGTQFDAFTTVLTAQATVTPGTNTHIKIVIGDALDEVWDSAVFLSGTCNDCLAPTIQQQPQSLALCPGSPASFTVQASGGAPLSYQWKKNGGNLADDGNISGSTTASLTINAVGAADLGSYTVEVSNPCGTVLSSAATLTATFGNHIDVAAGGTHTLVLQTDGTVWASGFNMKGQLGDGTTTLSVNRVQVANLSGVTDIAAGVSHSLALKSDGTVWGWGDNYNGQVGDGTTVQRWTPVQVTGLSGVSKIVAGGYFSLALKNDGTVWGWGDNWYGQLGDNSTVQRLSPVQVVGLTDVVTIAAGAHHALAVKSDGTVWAWGRNSNGQLGDGTTTHRSSPVQVSNLSAITMVAAGDAHSLAADTYGTVSAWGSNGQGQFGNGTQTSSTVPTWTGFYSAAGLACGGGHSVVVRTDGYVNAAGANTQGQLGDGTQTRQLWPITVSGLSGISEVAASSQSSFALSAHQSIWAWGINGGRLGDGNNLPKSVPVLTTEFGAPHINDQPTQQSVCPGYSTTLSVRAKGSALTYQWRQNGTPIAGATGSSYTIANATGNDAGYYDVEIAGTCGTVTSQSVPVTVGAPVITQQPPSQELCVGEEIYMRVEVIGTGPLTYQWYKNNQAIPNATYQQYKVVETSEEDSGEYFLAITGPCGTVQSSVAVVYVASLDITQSPQNQTVCHGNPVSFQVVAQGVGPFTYQWKKDGVDLTDDGNMWGTTSPTLTINAASGAHAGSYTVQVSNPCGSDLSSAATLTVNSGSHVSVSGGNLHSIVLHGNGTVSASGINSQGQLGDGTTVAKLSRVQVSGLSSITAISAGTYHNLALKSDGTVWAWGGNGNGQIGDGTTINRLTPVQVSGLSGVIKVAAGENFSLALKSDGTVWSWGRNPQGQLGDATTVQKLTPVQVVGLADVIEIAAGTSHSLALKNDGTVWAWGYNGNGQLGDGTYTSRSVPVQVSGLSGINMIAAGVIHSAAAQTGGAVWAWGSNWEGMFGDGTQSFGSNVPAQTAFWGAAAISCGSRHTLMLSTDGYVLGSGQNFYGQLGNGTQTQSFWPTYANISGVVRIEAGINSTHVIAADQTVWAWGQNAGRLGDDTNIQRLNPVLTSDFGLPHINDQPMGQSVCPGYSTTLTVRAKGSPTLSYQWKLWGNPISGATGSSYTISNATANDEGYYEVEVTGACGSVTSQPAYVSVGGPIITQQPQSLTTTEGEEIFLRAEVSGSAPLTFQWYYNGDPIPGAIYQQFKISEAYEPDSGEYKLIVTGPCGSVESSIAYVVVNP